MREIKFRVWCKNKNEWEKDVVVLDLEGNILDVNQRRILKKENHILMQYTGLKDRNGKEIYEGDILTSKHYPFQDEGKYNYHGIIEWDDELASFYMTKRLANSEKRGVSDGIGEQIDNIETFEVIGNIYENKDLIE